MSDDPRHDEAQNDEHRDELPADLDVSGYVGQYTFPDIRRRRIPAIVYLILSAGCFALWATHRGDDHVLVNPGTLVAAIALLLIGLYHWVTAWPKGAMWKLHLCEGELEPGNTGIGFYSDDLKGTVADLKNKGVKFAMDYTKTEWGELAQLEDPDGNVISILPGGP